MLAALTAALLVMASPSLPDDGRLAEVRPQLQRLVDQASAAGLPVELLVSKVREGLAKGVEPARIEGATERLLDSLEAAQRMVGARRGSTPAPLVRAVAEARLAGVALPAVEPLLDGKRPEP